LFQSLRRLDALKWSLFDDAQLESAYVYVWALVSLI